jgi:NADP-dependent 3-hydroxy acid dehydrogenase YdfG
VLVAGVAVVTGASSGIGRATARRLARDGFDVVLAARREDRLRELAAGTGGRAVPLDVTDDASVAGLAEVLDRELDGRCDVLVNVAGGAFGLDPVERGAVDDWQRMYDVNVLGTLRVTQALLPALTAGGGGTIVNLTSTAASVNYEGGAGYSAAKHAQHALTETLRLELSGRPVRVVEIAPGMVRTDEFSTVRFRGDEAAAAKIYEGVDRPLTAEDVADCVAFTVGLPLHVNIDLLTVRPLAQAAQHKVFRGPLFDQGSP